MPCPHNEISIVQRSQQQSAVAAAAYQSGEKLFCEYDQQVKHYPEKRGIVHNEILLPANAPQEYTDRNTLWNAAEAVEKQWNSQLARRWVLTIPREIPPDQYAVLVREFCEQQFVSKGMIADFAIHDPHPPGHNPHAHVMLTMRAMDEHGKWLPKSRKVYDLDENGERIKLPSGRWKSHKEDTVDWNDQKYCEIWRHEWEVIQNRYLETNDRPERVDLRSYARQGLDIVPTIHEGAAVRQMEKRGIQTNIGNLNREIRAANSLMKSIRQLKLCTVIDNILLNEKPADFEAFLQKLEQQGYEIKRGKHTSVKGARQKRFIRFRTLGAGYSEDEIKAVIAGEAEHRPHQKQPPKEKPFHLLVDIQAKLSEGKSESYARWAKRYNLKEMSKTLIFLQENKIGNIEEMQERVNAATARYHELGDSIKAAEQRMAEIAVLRAHIINYAKTRPVYDAYRKAGYSKKFLEEHREQITLHRAAKATFDEAGLKKLPKVKELNTEYSTLLSQKKAAYPAYRKARDEMQELMKAQKNVEIFFAEEKTTKEKAQTR